MIFAMRERGMAKIAVLIVKQRVNSGGKIGSLNRGDTPEHGGSMAGARHDLSVARDRFGDEEWLCFVAYLHR